MRVFISTYFDPCGSSNALDSIVSAFNAVKEYGRVEIANKGHSGRYVIFPDLDTHDHFMRLMDRIRTENESDVTYFPKPASDMIGLSLVACSDRWRDFVYANLVSQKTVYLGDIGSDSFLLFQDKCDEMTYRMKNDSH